MGKPIIAMILKPVIVNTLTKQSEYQQRRNPWFPSPWLQYFESCKIFFSTCKNIFETFKKNSATFKILRIAVRHRSGCPTDTVVASPHILMKIRVLFSCSFSQKGRLFCQHFPYRQRRCLAWLFVVAPRDSTSLPLETLRRRVIGSFATRGLRLSLFLVRAVSSWRAFLL